MYVHMGRYVYACVRWKGSQARVCVHVEAREQPWLSSGRLLIPLKQSLSLA